MSREMVQEVLARTGLSITEMGQDLWQVDMDGCTLVLVYKPESDVLEILLPLTTVPEGAGEEFYRFMLELNFDRILYGAFALKEREIVLVDRLNCADLHEEEVKGSVKALREAMLHALSALKEVSL